MSKPDDFERSCESDCSTDLKCREIVQHIIRSCNEDEKGDRVVIGFEPDCGVNSLTVHCADLGHSHVGFPGCAFEQLVDELHALLCHGRGLSFALTPEKPSPQNVQDEPGQIQLNNSKRTKPMADETKAPAPFELVISLRQARGVIVSSLQYAPDGWGELRTQTLAAINSGRFVLVPSTLTAENGAKGELSGEFSEQIYVANPEYCGCGECDCCIEAKEPERLKQEVPISWATIKDIYAKAMNLFSSSR